MNSFHHAALLGLLMALPSVSYGQAQATLQGTVRAADTGAPLVGASVALQGTARGASADATGYYRFSAPPGAYTLVVRSVGYGAVRTGVVLVAGQTQTADVTLEPGVIDLDAVTVKGEAFLPQNAAATAHVIGPAELRRHVLDNPLRLVEEIPGVDLGAYRQGGVADVFSIRGFGEGGHGGDVAVQVDGIPLNEADGHSDGYADLNVLVPLELQRVAVYKGPSSALFGNFARGGTLALDTRKGGTYRDASLTGGAYRTLDAQLALGQPIALGSGRAPLQTNLAGQLFSTDGYSANSDYRKGTAAGRLAYALSGRTDVSLSLRGHGGAWSAPGYIPEAQFESEGARSRQGPNAEDDGGSKSFFAQRVGLNHSLSDRLRLVTHAYAVQQDFTRWAKFGYGEGGQSERFNERDVLGAGASLNGRADVASVASHFVVGAEFYSEHTQRLRWATRDRVRQEQTERRDFTVATASLFAQAEFEPTPLFRPTLGLRYDRFAGDAENADPGQDVTRSDLNDYAHLSPKLGVRSTLAPGLDLRASATNGFVLPNGAAKFDAAFDVEPAEIWQYEVGATYSLAGRARLDVVGYVLDTSSEIAEDPPGSGAFRNAGQTRRRGVEAEASARLLAGLDARVALGLIETEIRDNPDSGLEGRSLTGVPARTLTVGLDYTSPVGAGARLHVRHTGPYQLTADNSAQYDGYTVANVALFYDLARLGRAGRLFVQIENALDARYAEAVFAGFDTLNYAPAPPRRLTLGLNVSL